MELKSVTLRKADLEKSGLLCADGEIEVSSASDSAVILPAEGWEAGKANPSSNIPTPTLPRFKFALAAGNIPLNPGERPSLNISCSLSDSGYEVARALFSSGTPTAMQLAELASALKRNMQSALNSINNTAMANNMILGSTAIVTALRFSSGVSAFFSPPTILSPCDSPHQIQLTHGIGSRENYMLSGCLLTIPCRICFKVEDEGDVANLAKYAEAVEFYISEPAAVNPEEDAPAIIAATDSSSRFYHGTLNADGSISDCRLHTLPDSYASTVAWRQEYTPSLPSATSPLHKIGEIPISQLAELKDSAMFTALEYKGGLRALFAEGKGVTPDHFEWRTLVSARSLPFRQGVQYFGASEAPPSNFSFAQQWPYFSPDESDILIRRVITGINTGGKILYTPSATAPFRVPSGYLPPVVGYPYCKACELLVETSDSHWRLPLVAHPDRHFAQSSGSPETLAGLFTGETASIVGCAEPHGSRFYTPDVKCGFLFTKKGVSDVSCGRILAAGVLPGASSSSGTEAVVAVTPDGLQLLRRNSDGSVAFISQLEEGSFRAFLLPLADGLAGMSPLTGPFIINHSGAVTNIAENLEEKTGEGISAIVDALPGAHLLLADSKTDMPEIPRFYQEAVFSYHAGMGLLMLSAKDPARCFCRSLNEQGWSVATIASEDSGKGQHCTLLTRPIKLGIPVNFKRIMLVEIPGIRHPEEMETILYGSTDGAKWHAQAYAKGPLIRPALPQPVKFLRLLIRHHPADTPQLLQFHLQK